MRPVVIANFDAEIEMARETTPGPHPGVPAAIAARLAALAPRLEVLADGAEVVSSAGAVPEGATAVLGWAETTSVARARVDRCLDLPGRAAPSGRVRHDPPSPLWAAIAPPEVAARVNDRRFWLALARREGWALPETAEIGAYDELVARLPALCAASADGGWSVKAPLSAAGRERVHRWGPEIPGDIETRLRRLIDRFGAVIAEPWMPRIADAGVAGIAFADRVELFAPHRVAVDRAGTFKAIELDAEVPRAEVFAAAARVAGSALRAAGYRGGFGIDGFVYRDPSGADAIAPCCEINARLTFGLIADIAGCPF